MLFSIFVLYVLIANVECHSHLANPWPTRRLDCRAGNGRPRDCYGPCPPVDTYGEPTGISSKNPAENWRRGERRRIRWHRNNHGHGESGFVRFSLVPIKKMYDKKAHEQFTIQISCWSSGLHKCNSRNLHVCGNDADGLAYTVDITVPTSYPDGIYSFGWAWFGGGDYRGNSFFGDYFSCSFVRIQGGSRPTFVWKPVFLPGINEKYRDACMSATSHVGVCSREPCRGHRVKPMQPRSLPRSILYAEVAGLKSNSGTPLAIQRIPSFQETLKEQAIDQSPRGKVSLLGINIYNLANGRNRIEKRKAFWVRLRDFKKGFTLGASVKGDVADVSFSYWGKRHVERLAPYLINGNSRNRYWALRCRRGTRIRLVITIRGRHGQKLSGRYRIRCV